MSGDTQARSDKNQPRDKKETPPEMISRWGKVLHSIVCEHYDAAQRDFVPSNRCANIRPVMDRKATAVWKGNLKDGKGTLDVRSGAFEDLPYSFRMRFEDEPGTNPEELVAAAHAGCYAMALSGNLEKAGFVAEEISATATVTLDMVDGAPTVTKSHLQVEASVPGISNEQFEQIVQQTKDGCPISRLLTAELSVTAKLKS